MSSGSESDEEYVPGEPEQVSEEDSANEETDLQFENEQEQKTTKKRKSNLKGKGRKKIKTRNNEKEILDDDDEEKDIKLEEKVNPEEEKKREDDLWAKFLEGTDSKPKTVKQVKDSAQILTDTSNKTCDDKNSTKQTEDERERERRIFDFAGEKIVVENNVVVDKMKSDDSSPSASKTQAPSVRKGGGISNILDQLNKKNKLSTLEKSKLDWNTFKKDEGIEEEIVSHNKGKAGYLDRRDFLERAEFRQYEIERDLRMSRRSNR